ncbi:FAD-dependent oxidoreductase [Deinococcus lacus]|uniref:FAD-dependent oxidoreductase n=1 Tax=Deinococcus lacus TaxID=392561 RepID=A0ABW1YBS2_9DEIO
MPDIYTPEQPLRAAIIGSGPSGIFAAEALLRSGLPVQVDVFDRLPTPYGLVRYGVAPDHLTIKSVTKGFEKTLSDERVRFFGNVEFGRDVTYEEMRAHYAALIYTVGASSDRRLGIPGEDLTGNLSATEFVAWYNGHPDAAARDIDLSARGVAVVGVGNVALDVSRILAKTPGELHASDIAPHALEALEQNQVTDIHILGRRGAAQAKFTTKELREFGELSSAGVTVRPEEIEVSEEDEAAADNTVKKNLEVLREFRDAPTPATAKPRQVHLRFLVSPAEILGDDQGRVRAIRLERNRLENGNAVGTGEFEELPVQMVIRSVGYLGQPLPGVPFDERRGVIPNQGGRVEGRTGEYTAGWIKRGPSGVVGTNRKCAADTVALLIEDAQSGRLPQQSGDIAPLLASRGTDVYSFHDWRTLDAHEQSEGQSRGRPRHKVVHREHMLSHRSSR